MEAVKNARAKAIQRRYDDPKSKARAKRILEEHRERGAAGRPSSGPAPAGRVPDGAANCDIVRVQPLTVEPVP
jgi:hypothetical protein